MRAQGKFGAARNGYGRITWLDQRATWEEWVARMMDRKCKWTVRHPRKAEENRVREAF